MVPVTEPWGLDAVAPNVEVGFVPIEELELVEQPPELPLTLV